MKHIPYFLCLFLITLITSCSSKKETSSPDDIDSRVKELISKMSVEEKVGQMTQVNITVLMKDGKFDPELVKQAVNDYKVGSILNTTATALTPEEWHAIVTTVQDAALKNSNKIPVLYGVDAIHGPTYIKDGILYPQNIAAAASRDTILVKKAAKVTAMETRATGIRWNFAPVLDVGREPLWSRFPETFGEDPYLVSQMGVASFHGYQEGGLKKNTAVAACMKHYLGYSLPESGKDRTPAYIPETQLREIFLPPFKAAVDAGAMTVMINSGEINGVPVHASKFLLTDILRTELGFKGIAVSDWEDVIRLHTRHKVADTPKEAVRLAVEAGLDMSMVPFSFSFADHLIALVKENKISEARLDESVTRILTVKFKLGLFDNPYPEKETFTNINRAGDEALALEMAREAVTLLKNDTIDKANNKMILPLAKDKKVMIAGPGAESLSALNGCWSFSWQGQDLTQYPAYYKTFTKAVQEKIGVQNVVSMSVSQYDSSVNYDANALRAKASSVDYIILCLGENAHAESPGSIKDLTLDKKQIALAEAAIATGKPVILVLLEGRPRIIRDIEPGMKAIVDGYWPGSKGAEALADVIFGDVNPSGKLPFTYPRNTGDIILYDHKFSEIEEEGTASVVTLTGYIPQWPFGYGLSYTTFDYSDIRINKDTISGAEKLIVTIDVKNSGAMDGKIAIDLFTRDHYASITPSFRKLRKFTKISLKAGETKQVTFELTAADLSFINASMQRVTEDGAFDVAIGDKVKTFYYKN